MHHRNSSALRSSVSSALAVAVITLVGWSFDSYTDYLYRQANPAAAPVQAATQVSEESRNG